MSQKLLDLRYARRRMLFFFIFCLSFFMLTHFVIIHIVFILFNVYSCAVPCPIDFVSSVLIKKRH